MGGSLSPDDLAREIAQWPVWAPGTRVRVLGTPSGTSLRRATGTVLSAHPSAPGAYYIQMDEPVYVDGCPPPSTVLLEDGDNLRRVEEASDGNEG